MQIENALLDVQQASNGLRGILPGGTSTSLPGVSYNPSDPSSTLGQITRRDQARAEQDYYPVQDDAIASLDDLSIIEDAKSNVRSQTSFRNAKQRTARNLARYGVRATAAQRKNETTGLRILL